MPTDSPDFAADLRDVATLATRPERLDLTLAAALDALAEVVPYDLAVVLELVGQRLQVRCARGPLANAKVQGHELDLTRAPELKAAILSGKPRAFTETEHDRDHGGEGDPYHGVVDLPHGHSCLVVPLAVGGKPIGAMTFDRSVCGRYDDQTIALVTVYGQLVSLAMAVASANRDLAKRNDALAEQNRALSDDLLVGIGDFSQSASLAMVSAVALAKQVAPTSAAVLITGETGTGKEVAARAIHGWSRRPAKPFLKLNCSALPEHLVESELFGHVKGAFSGAERDRPGRFLAADGGTLLLDEIGDLPLSAQAKLLRVLQEGAFEAVGSDKTVQVDVRIIAATHVDLPRAVGEGRFRADLYHRLAVFPIHLPPLRERVEDIPQLAQVLLARIAARHRGGPWSLSAAAVRSLVGYAWPGNVRELEHALERAAILAPDGRIEPHHLAFPGMQSPRISAHTPIASLTSTHVGSTPLAAVERQAILAALAASGGKVYGTSGAASRLGLKPSTLQHRMRKHGIEKP
ncbi:MAG TPA: sigma 54-interacting transcriptional regulator [Planctomycetota bacterium]|nr:sigma 54-interacting transcriptional regulator [Planctomycetota bacterium]